MVLADWVLLLILIPLTLLWVGGWIALRVMERRVRFFSPSAVRFSSTARLRRLRPSWTVRLRGPAQGLRLVVVGLLVLAMGRPQTGRELSKITTRGIDILLVVDTSGSMQAVDLDADRSVAQRRDRLEVVKDVVEGFIRSRESDQIGLVVFGTHAFPQCPLTLDHGIVSSFLDRLEIGMAGEATAIGDALGIAVKRLRESEAKSKVVILLTDGQNTSGLLPPKKAAEIAKKYGVKVYTIGAGTRGRAPVVVQTVFGPQVQYIEADLDEPTLRQIAETTGGAYFRAEDAEALEAIYAEIDELEKTEIKQRSYVDYDERFRWLALPALLVLLLEILLMGTLFRKIP